jgi:hypothetical protein
MIDGEEYEEVQPAISGEDQDQHQDISRYLGRSYHLDANLVYAKRRDGDWEHLLQLQKWGRYPDGKIGTRVIDLFMSEKAQQEAARNDMLRAKKASEHFFIHVVDSFGGEAECKKRIEDILFPLGAKKPKDKNDVTIVYEARQDNAILVTNDRKHILSKRAELEAIGVRVSSPSDAVREIKSLIEERDRQAREWAKKNRRRRPEWVGKD